MAHRCPRMTHQRRNSLLLLLEKKEKEADQEIDFKALELGVTKSCK